ncbi:unnamed protein product [Cuscuta campestris]|uniref:Reverse transcriptase Ty1/copia-type domain-containing protein n=1 Tax=Cuscuta campestris TaxID=132261 RepID=A0A484MGS7_9ASTE|nr:unnamed protein product [Cuscuta campestris]
MFGVGRHEGGLYYLKKEERSMVCSDKKVNSFDLWQKHLGHPSSHVLSLVPGVGEIPDESGSSSSPSIDHFENDEEMPAEGQIDRSTRNGRPGEGGEADRLQTVDLMDCSDVNGQPSERQKDGFCGDEQTADLVDRPDIHGRPSERQNDGTVVHRSIQKLVIKKFHKFMKKEFEQKGRKHDGPPKCYDYGEIDHIKPRCPKAKHGKDKPGFNKHRAYISWGGDSNDESTDQEEDEAANLCLMAHEDQSDDVQEAYRVFNKRTLTIEESSHVVFSEDNARLVRKDICDDLADSLERIHVEDDEADMPIYTNPQPQTEETPQVTVENEEDQEDEEVHEEAHEQEETELLVAWRMNKNHPLDQEFSKLMTSEFEMLMMGELTFFLLLQVKQMSDGTFICQTKYCKELLKRFEMDNAKAMVTPMSTSDHLDKDEKGGQKKLSRTSKNVASTSAPPPPTHKYLDGSFLWFNDRAEATRFSEKFEHREILPPRFSIARFIHDSIPREAQIILERGNFLDLLYIKKAHYQPFLVRAFYSNLTKDKDGALISNVSGVDIYLNEENIQILTGLRRNGEDLGLYVGEGGARFNETALLEEVGIRNFAPHSPTAAPDDYFHESRVSIHILCLDTNPQAKERHLRRSAAPYALFVMVILDEYNIKTDVGAKRRGTKHWEIDESSFHSGTDETPFRQPRPRCQPRDASSNTPSLDEQMASLTTTLSRIDTNVSQTAQNVNISSRELHGYFDFVNYPYAQMVSYAPPPNLGGEPSGTNNVGGEEEVNDEEEEEEEAEEEEEEEEEDDDDDDDEEKEDINEEQLLDDLSLDF